MAFCLGRPARHVYYIHSLYIRYILYVHIQLYTCFAGRPQTTMFTAVQANGHHSANIPQNCSTPDKCSQRCSLGCGPGGKQDTVRTFLADAASTGLMCVLASCAASRVVTGTEASELRSAGVLVTIPTAKGDSTITAFIQARFPSLNETCMGCFVLENRRFLGGLDQFMS